MARSTRSSSTKKKPVEEEESVVEEEETSVEEDDDDEEQEEEQALTQQLAPVQEENDSDAADQESEGASIIAEEGASVVPKGLALKTLTDIIEYYCEMVFIDRRKRQEYIAVIEFYYRLHPNHNVGYGRLYCKNRLALLLADSAGIPPYGFQESKPDDDLPMIEWGRERWELLADDLKAVRDEALRKDATVSLPDDPNQVIMQEDEEEDDERKKAPWFTTKFDFVLDLIEVNKVVAPIRSSLESQIDAEKEGRPRITGAALKEIRDYVENMDDSRSKNVVGALFDDGSSDEEEDGTKGSSSSKKRKASQGLVLMNQLGGYLRDKPFDLDYVQSKIETLLHRWNSALFGNEDPALIQLKYGIPQESTLLLTASTPRSHRKSAQRKGPAGMKRPAEDQAAIEDLREDRAALKDNHGKDPIHAARAKAARAGGDTANDDIAESPSKPRSTKKVGGGKLLEKSKNATRLGFDESDEEGDYDKITLGDLASPPAKKRAKSSTKGPAPDEGIFGEFGKVNYRRFWSEEETTALREGYKVHGKSRWNEIKHQFPYILRNRTSVQIKDKWRTMLKNHEIEE